MTTDFGATAVFDIAIVGAGVVGCALAREMTLAGARVALLERGRDILQGASKANSALLHTGFDAPPGSLELACMREGREVYLALREQLNLPVLETSALVVAWTEQQLARLPELQARAHQNGVAQARAVGRRELRDHEPGLDRAALGALLVPGEFAIDPWSAPLAYALQALANGALVERDCEVTGGDLRDGVWRLRTGRGELRARAVFNAAGLWGDRVEAIARQPRFRIRPRKGQFVVFDKSAAKAVRNIILPVPDPRTKGVLVAPTVFGNVLVGPTAEEQDDRERATVEQPAIDALVARAGALVPALAEQPITALYAGLRPATEHKDYQIPADPDRRWITVGGIRSTGLTAALGIAAHVRRLYEASFRQGSRALEPVPQRLPAAVPNLAEHRPRPYQQGGCGEIVCHCERVTRSEIEAALQGPLPAADLGGLKRRTRCMMGPCQGFYCAGRVCALTAGRIHWPFPERRGP